MKNTVTRVAIVGCGIVGTTVAYSLVMQGVAAEIALIPGHNRKKAWGEALDLQHSMEFQDRNVRVFSGDYAACRDAGQGFRQQRFRDACNVFADGQRAWQKNVGSTVLYRLRLRDDGNFGYRQVAVARLVVLRASHQAVCPNHGEQQASEDA